MGDTYTHLLTHFIFATKNREPFMTDAIRPRLHDYIGGVLREHDCAIRSIGSVEDHIHMLARRHPDRSESEVMRLVKTNSSKWIHDTFDDMRAFQWQRGYAAFSVSLSNATEVDAYITTQREHHRQVPYIEELKAYLQRHGLEYDDRYLE